MAMATSKLIELAENLWTVEYDLFTFGIHFPGRMVVIKLEDGGLWLHSPVPIDDELAEELAALGPVKHLVAPNTFHHVHLRKVKARYPEALLWGAAGLETKRKDLEFDHILSAEPGPQWPQDIELVNFDCISRLCESVFLHPSSRSLVVTDLFMNIRSCRGLMSKMVYWFEGAYGQLAVPRLIRFLVKDRAAAAAAASRIIAFAPAQLIMAHGETVTEDAATIAADALQVFKPTLQLQSGVA